MPTLIVGAIIALIGLFPMEYFGYTLVRIGVFSTCLLSLFVQKNKKYLPEILGVPSTVILSIIALLYNPIFPVFLTREIWIVLDIIVALIMISLHKGCPKQPASSENIQKEEIKQETLQPKIKNAPHNNVSDTPSRTEERADKAVSHLLWFSITTLLAIVITVSLFRS